MEALGLLSNIFRKVLPASHKDARLDTGGRGVSSQEADPLSSLAFLFLSGELLFTMISSKTEKRGNSSYDLPGERNSRLHLCGRVTKNWMNK